MPSCDLAKSPSRELPLAAAFAPDTITRREELAADWAACYTAPGRPWHIHTAGYDDLSRQLEWPSHETVNAEGKVMSRAAFWQGKSVVVTGASSGIGLALCRELGRHGARIGMIARGRERLESAVAALLETGAEVSCYAADARSREEMASAVKCFADCYGPCDVLIANAGIYRLTSGLRFEADSAADVIATNVEGVVNAIGAVLPSMVERNRGHLVGVASLGAMLGLPGAGAYCASKAAVKTLLESLRIDLRKTNVRVTTVFPGFVDTPMITDEERRTLHHLLSAEQAAKRIVRAIERGRAEYWFPWQLWIQLRLLRAAPLWLYKLLAPLVEEMEESEASA